MTTDVFDSPAFPLVLQLEDQGFAIQLDRDGGVTVEPGSRLTVDQRQALVQYKTDVVTILRCCDPTVVARRDCFREQIDAAPVGTLPVLVYVPHVPYVPGRCFSCGVGLMRPEPGRCVACALALRLALRWPVSAEMVHALLEARVA